MGFTLFATIILLHVGPLLSEGSSSSWSPPTSTTTDSDTQGSSGTGIVDRSGSPLGFNKGQVYNNAQSFPYSNVGSGFQRNYNYNYIAPRPTASYYGRQRGDKSEYGGSIASGRMAGGYIPSAGYTYTSRFSKGFQDPIQNRQGFFNLPQHLRTNYVYGGSFQKGSSGYSYPGNTGQVYRGSRILYEEPNKAQFTIPTRTKSTGVYIIPTPSKLYFDGLKN